jgi:putative acetyltransferase
MLAMPVPRKDRRSMLIRPERRADFDGLDELLRGAFASEDEAGLVRALRKAPEYVPALALVSERMAELVGYVMFTTAEVVGRSRNLPVLALAPVAVAVSHQRRGVGKEMVEIGLELAAARGDAAVIVLGQPDYFGRFGFKPASLYGVRAPFADVSDESFMALELVPGALEGRIGVVRYAEPFSVYR